MSYPATKIESSYTSPTELSEDDVVGVSLLYPTAGFTGSRGAVTGHLAKDAAHVPFAYVQAVYPGSRPRLGPGAFADVNGYFHLEGLHPGSVLLWVHPILVHQGAVAHDPLLDLARDQDALDLLDQWQWARIERGKVVGLPFFSLAPGRSP